MEINFFTEKTPLDPRSPYSASKAGADHIVLAYGETYKMPITITRCSNNYGPYHFLKIDTSMIKNVLKEKNFLFTERRQCKGLAICGRSL